MIPNGYQFLSSILPSESVQKTMREGSGCRISVRASQSFLRTPCHLSNIQHIRKHLTDAHLKLRLLLSIRKLTGITKTHIPLQHKQDHPVTKQTVKMAIMITWGEEQNHHQIETHQLVKRTYSSQATERKVVDATKSDAWNPYCTSRIKLKITKWT